MISRKVNIFILLCALVLSSVVALAEDRVTSYNMLQELVAKEDISDTERVQFYLSTIKIYSNTSNDTVILLANQIEYWYQDQAVRYNKKQCVWLPYMADIFNKKGSTLLTMKRFTESLNAFAEAIVVYKRCKCDAKKLASTYRSIASVYQNKRRFNKSRDFLLKARKIFKETMDTIGIISINTNLGSLYLEYELYDESVYYSTLALEGLKSRNDPRYKANESILALNVGLVYGIKGDYRKQRSFLRQANLNLQNFKNDIYLRTLITTNLCVMYNVMYNLPYEKVKEIDVISRSDYSQWKENQLDSSEKYINIARLADKQLRGSESNYYIDGHYGRYLFYRNKYTLAEKYIDKSIRVSREKEDISFYYEVSNYKLDLLEKLGRYQEFYELMNEANKTKNEVEQQQKDVKRELLVQLNERSVGKFRDSLKLVNKAYEKQFVDQLETANKFKKISWISIFLLIFIVLILSCFALWYYQKNKTKYAKFKKDDVLLMDDSLKKLQSKNQQVVVASKKMYAMQQEMTKSNIETLSSVFYEVKCSYSQEEFRYFIWHVTVEEWDYTLLGRFDGSIVVTNIIALIVKSAFEVAMGGMGSVNLDKKVRRVHQLLLKDLDSTIVSQIAYNVFGVNKIRLEFGTVNKRMPLYLYGNLSEQNGIVPLFEGAAKKLYKMDYEVDNFQRFFLRDGDSIYCWMDDEEDQKIVNKLFNVKMTDIEEDKVVDKIFFSGEKNAHCIIKIKV